jgi:hypothetical protein
MRKIFLTLLISLLIASAGYALSTDDEIIHSIFDGAKVDRTFDSDATELKALSNQEKPFENLYLFMYQNVKEAPKKAAIEETALKIGYKEEDLEKIILDGDISLIRNYLSADKGSSQEEISKEYESVSGAYQNELEFQTENRALLYETLASEVFMNGDLSDSAGVDILSDLNIIHQNLFGSDMVYPDRGGSEDVELASEELFDLSLLKVRREAEPESDTNEDSEAMICLDDEELATAIEEFEAIEPEDSGASTVEEVVDTSDSYDTDDGNTDGGSDNPDEDSSDGPSGDDSNREPLEEFVSEISGTLGNWDRALPCDEIFCITVELISETDEAAKAEDNYESSQDCIACHISYILERLEQTTDESMVPSRVSTNWFEDASCKDAGSKVGMSLGVYTIAKPILQDPGDDIDENANDNVDELEGTLSALGANTDSGNIDENTPSENDAARILTTHEGASFEEIVQANLEASEIRQQDIEEAFDEFMLRTRLENSNELYTQVSSELSVLVTYFKNFEKALETTSNGALEELLAKKYCE